MRSSPQRPPARLTQSPTSFDVEDCKSGVQLLLLPALGLLRALFRRRLRLRLSLLRHAALLAIDDNGDGCRSVPAGIANTATELH